MLLIAITPFKKGGGGGLKKITVVLIDNKEEILWMLRIWESQRKKEKR